MEAVPIQSENFKLGFIGAGKMAESIARGVVQSGVLPPQRISTAIHSNPSRGTAFQSLGISVYSHNTDVVDASDVIIFSVKPQVGNAISLSASSFIASTRFPFCF
ncbi:hypothetical protein ES288_D06G203900v1 [Gossypium darwinii]|uniref:Pyrroline-5-carboxylate reductase catalytic N-terminal domain-containing protein n=2 Tax=Gossypium TaxID=3633 RepID=A0A5D2KKN1_GOSTO|nr:hypothetical protein ES288_D06G203900v1 [Gossypium darwinii]TYH67718.1 hypothetical protein ES332_D06G207600v1 [Gossypium tomentosum]